MCDRHDVLLVADEIVSGFGRTGEWFAVQHHGATPDIITFGKAIGGGVLPLSGMIAAARSARWWGQSPTGFSYGHTFSGYPLGCAVGCAVIDVIEQEGLLEAARRKGARLRARLEEIAGRHPPVRALRGRGLLQGIELHDPATGDRFDASRRRLEPASAARERDLMIYSCPTPVLNRMMDAVLLAPPLIITDAELDTVLERLDDAFGAFEAAL